jgi:hypothetical protein
MLVEENPRMRGKCDHQQVPVNNTGDLKWSARVELNFHCIVD